MKRENNSHKHTHIERIINVSAPHLIKPPWKKQKDKTYRIRMTCGSILRFKIAPQSRWITCRKFNFGNQQIHWAAGETGLKEEGIIIIVSLSFSQWSKLVFGETSPPPTKSRGLHTSTQQAGRRLTASGGLDKNWSVTQSVCWSLCCWRGVSDCVSGWACVVLWQCFFFLPPRSKKKN